MKRIELKETIKKRITSILSENQMTKDEAFRALRDIHSNLPKWRGPEGKHYTELMGQALDVLQAGEISKMMDRERGLNEGTWSLGTVMQVQNFLRDMEKIKNHYYDIVGDDQVFNGLDNAIARAKELEMEAPENRSDISEDRYKDVEHMFSGEKGPESRYDKVVRILMSHGQSEEEAKRITRELSQLKENEEPTSADLKKKDSVTTTSNKLQKLVKQMKEKAKEFKAAEGDKKDKLKDELKKMTKEKKELEKSI